MVNEQRLLEPIGYIPPAEAETNYYQQLSGQVVSNSWESVQTQGGSEERRRMKAMQEIWSKK